MDIDLAGYRLHRVAEHATFEGRPVPGLRAEFYRRRSTVDGRLVSCGRYFLGGREVLRAWGYVEEEHCRAWSARGAGGAWQTPVPGCPPGQALCGDDGAGLSERDREVDGSWAGG